MLISNIKKLSITVQVLLLFGVALTGVMAAEFQILRASSRAVPSEGLFGVFAALGLQGWLIFGLALVLVLCVVVYVHHILGWRLRVITEFAEDAASARWHEDIGGLRIERHEGSRNELQRLAFAVNALYASVKLLSFKRSSRSLSGTAEQGLGG